MGIVSTGLSEHGVKSAFFETFDSTRSHYERLCTRVPSSTDKETYRWLGSFPQMREWGTGRVAYGVRSEKYDVENLDYEATVEADRNELADDQTGQIMMRIREMASAAATHKDFLVEELLKNGGTAGFNSYDGVSFFSANHVSGSSGAQSNDLAAVRAGAAQTNAERRAALAKAIGAMLSYKDDRGQSLRIAPDGLVVVVPPVELVPWLEALNQTLVPGQESVVGNNALKAAAEVVCLPGLTDADEWFLAQTSGVIRPFIFQDREPIEFQMVGPGSETEFRIRKHLYGVTARYRITYGQWFRCIRMTWGAAE